MCEGWDGAWVGPSSQELRGRVNELRTELGVEPSNWERLLGLIAPLETHCPEMYAHSLRVGWYAGRLAQREGLDVRLALHGGCAHDVGKVDVPLAALRASEFGEAEMSLLRVHPRAGFERLKATNLYSAIIAGMHHQFQPDPYGIGFDELTEFGLNAEARISLVKVAALVSACDFYDALTTRDNDRGLVADSKDPAHVREHWLARFRESERIAWLQAHDLTGAA